MTRLAEFRRKYPQYDDMSDRDLADALHAKYYSDLPISDYYDALGLEQTSVLGALGEAGKRLAGGVATGTARIGTGLAELVPFIDDESAQAVQKDVDEFVAEKLAYDPAYDESYIAQLGETVGEMAPMVGSLFIPGGAPARAAKLLTMVGPAVSEGGMDRAEYEERTGEDLSTAERLVSKGVDIGLGRLEQLGLPARVVKGLPKGFFQTPEGNPILKRIESMVASGLREGVQEVGQGIARDISTLAIYDPDRKIADSAIEDFTLGGGAGAVFDLAIGLAQQPLRGRKGRAPKPIEEMSDEEVEAEIEERQRFDEAEKRRRERMDETIAAADIGPQIPVREDPLDPTEVDPELDAEEIASQVILRLGSRMPVGKTFSVETEDGKSFAQIDGEQFGPAIEDPTVAQELSNRLTETSQQLEKSAGIEYIVETSGIEYTEQQADEVRRLGRSIPSPQQRVISAEDANLATGKDIASVINDMMARKKATEESGRTGISFEEAYEIARAETDTEAFTLEEVRAANKGDIGNLGDVIAEKDADFLAFEPQEPVTPTAPIDPTRPRQPALGRRQQALAALSRSFDNIIASERAFTDLLARKRIDTTVDSEPFRGLIKKITGKTPSKKSPLENLTPNERRYLYHRLRKLPSFQEQATQIPDFSTKTPDGELVRIARRQIEVDRPAQVDPVRVLDDLVSRGFIPQDVADSLNGSAPPPAGFNPSAILGALVQKGLVAPEVAKSLNEGAPRQRVPQAEVRRVEAEARRTARPLPRNQARQVLEQYPRAAQLSLAELESYSPSLPSSPDVYTEGSRDVGAVRKGDYRADLGIPSEDAYFEVLDAKRQLEGVPAGQEIVPFDINESALGQQLRDALKKFGIDDEYAVRMVEKVGNARRDSDGNIYIMPIKSDPKKVVYGSAQAGAKVIQVGLDGVMDLVNKGATYEQAVARVMNHEILHALRAMDLFTASEYSLLERLSRKYQKPGTGKTYGQWAFDEYGDASAVVQQEEAIAELISDSLTTGVVMDGTVKKPTGKPQSIFKKIVNFFKGMVGVAKNNDVESFKDLVDNIQSGVVGRRERGQVRTPFRTERRRGEVAERGITKEDIELETGKRKRPLNAKQVTSKVKRDLPDAPVAVDEAMLSSRRLEGMPESFDVDGQAVEFGYHQPAVDAARRYAEKAGIRYEPLTEYAPIDRKMARKIAVEYDLMEDAPNDPEVKAAYDAMIDETLAQYEEILNSGLTVQFIKGDDPYGNPRNAILDVINNNHMYVFSTRDGYGMDELTPEVLEKNPMLRETSYKTADGDPMLANDVFRVVHDYFGHIKNGVGFRARGEENAWQSHAAMYSPLARRAMTSETRGQNSWVNFGPEADFNATASGADTVYADQKVGLLPLWVSEEARQSDPRRSDPSVFQEGLEGAIGDDGKLQISHFSRERIARTDPEMAGRGADKRRRYAPKGTYFGIVKADENGYRREAILGNVENTFSVDPLLIYPLNKDPYNLIARNPAGNLDWDGTLKNLNDKGFIGFWANDQRIGKVAFVNQPLISDESVAEVRTKPTTKSIETEVIAPRQTITPEQAEEAVKKNIESIEANPLGVPRFSVKASPEAQYIAQNPERGLPSDDPMFSVGGDIPAVDKLTKGPEREDTNGRVFMRVLETGPIGVALTKLKAGALNRYAALEKYYQKIPGLRELEAESSAIAAALMSDKSKAILASAVKYGVPVYNNGYTRVEEFVHDGETYRGLIGVMSLIFNKDVGDLRKLAQAYAMVQRGDYLKGRDKLTPVDPKSRKEILEAVDALTDANGYNPVKKWHEVWSAYNNKTIEFLKATGILNDETADVWKASSYIPFYRSGVSEDALPNVAKNIFGDLTRMSEFRAYQGSDKAVDVGLVESVVLNLSAAIDMGMKNVAQQRIVRDMQNMGIARQIKSGGAIPKGVNAVDFKVNGKKVRFEIDDNLIHDSMISIGAGAGEQLAIKYLGMPANFLRETITRDPGFMMVNMMRDTLSTYVTSGASFVPVIDTAKGWLEGVEKLERLGVIGGYDFSIDKKDILKYYKAEQKRREKSTAPLDLIKRVWDWAGEATTRSDAATRNAVYEDVLARTGNEAEAAFQASEIINFARRGANPLVRVITAAIPFLNARFQGLDVFVRAATGNYSTRKDLPPASGQLKLAYRAGLMTSLTALYYLMVSEEDWYKEQEDHIRELNWLVPTASGVPFRIPIPFEVGLFFKTIPEAILANFFGNQSDRELRETIQRGVTSTLEINPFSVQAFGPLVEAAFNYNSFTGRPIVPYYVDKMTPGLTGTLNSTQIATDIGKVLPISPLKMDHIISGYSGTIGGYVVSAVDALYRQARGVDDKRPEKAIFQYPLIKRFFASKEGSGLRTDAYDLYNDVYEVVTTINALEKQGREDELRAYIESRQHVLALKSPVYNIKKQLDKARDQKRQVVSSNLDPEVKRQMIEDIDSDLNEYLKVVPRLKQEMGAPFVSTTF